MKRFALLFVLLAVVGCNRSNPPAAPGGGGTAPTGDMGVPAGTGAAGDGATSGGTAAQDDKAAVLEVARRFTEAKDKEEAMALMTAKARAAMQADNAQVGGLAEPGTKTTLGEATVTGDTAEVAVTVDQNGVTSPGRLLLRREREWRMYGFATTHPFFGKEVTFDFEDPEGSIKAAMEAAPDAIRQGFEQGMNALKEGLENAFDPKKMAADQRAKKLAEAEAVAAIAGISPEEFEASWKVGFETKGSKTGEVIDKLAEKLAIQIDREGVADKLEMPLDVELKGESNLAALAAVATALDAHLEFAEAQPSGLFAFGGQPNDSPPAPVRIVAGKGELPVVSSGPFLLEVGKLIESPPHGTGSIAMAVRGFGLPAVVVAQLENQSMGSSEVAIQTTEGESLVDDGGGTLMFLGASEAGRVALPLNRSLKNLVKGRKELPPIKASVKFKLPVRVETLEFASLAAGQQVKSGEATISIERANKQQQPSFGGEVEEQLAVSVKYSRTTAEQLHFVAYDAAGGLLPVEKFGAFGFGDEGQVDVNISGEPAKLAVKFVAEQKELVYAFEVPSLPLTRSSDQPERIEEPTFAGHEAPLSFEFVGIAGEENFRKVKLKVTNHTNLDVLQFSMQLNYLDGAGKALSDFPAGHSGTHDLSEGKQEPCVVAGATEEIEITAFFMPPETAKVDVRLQDVKFINATQWQAPPQAGGGTP